MIAGVAPGAFHDRRRVCEEHRDEVLNISRGKTSPSYCLADVHGQGGGELLHEDVVVDGITNRAANYTEGGATARL